MPTTTVAIHDRVRDLLWYQERLWASLAADMEEEIEGVGQEEDGVLYERTLTYLFYPATVDADGRIQVDRETEPVEWVIEESGIAEGADMEQEEEIDTDDIEWDTTHETRWSRLGDYIDIDCDFRDGDLAHLLAAAPQ
jgi:hypothetical protein